MLFWLPRSSAALRRTDTLPFLLSFVLFDIHVCTVSFSLKKKKNHKSPTFYTMISFLEKWKQCCIMKDFPGDRSLEGNMRSTGRLFMDLLRHLLWSLSEPNGIGTLPCWNWLCTLFEWACRHTNWWVEHRHAREPGCTSHLGSGRSAQKYPVSCTELVCHCKEGGVNITIVFLNAANKVGGGILTNLRRSRNGQGYGLSKETDNVCQLLVKKAFPPSSSLIGLIC